MPNAVVPVYVHLPLDVVEAVEAVAREERTTKSEVYRRVLRAWLDDLNADPLGSVQVFGSVQQPPKPDQNPTTVL